MRILPGSLHLALLAGTALVSPLAHAQPMPAPNAAPVLDRVVAGGITIQQNAANTQVTQTQQRGVVDWRSFDVGRDHAVQFRQPSSSAATLNRVTGPDPSVIAGRISANGQIAIVNRSGVVFAQGAQVEAAGLIASAAGITNENFLAGGPRLTFDQPANPGARVENAGSITIREAGLAGLVAPQVVNRGAIVAHMGRVALGGAETAVVDLHGDGLVSLEVTRPVSRAPADGGALVSNTGTIEATGGTVLLTAQAADGIVQNLVRAGGRIAAGTDAATGRTGQVALRGTGGAIIIEGEASAVGSAPGTRGGSVTAIADRVLVASTGRVDASGRAGGGSVGIGAEGRLGTPRIAQRAGTAPGAVVHADATENGPGGTIRIDSLRYTAHAGTASARGGPAGGDGGMIEISGGQGLRVSGAADISASAGQAGTVLLDPVTIDIVATGGNVTGGDIAGGILAEADPPANALIDASLIDSFAGNLRLEATSDITVSAAVNKPAGNLTLFSSTGTIAVNQPVALGAGDLLLQAGGQIALNANLAANRVDLLAGGDITQLVTAGITAGTLNVQSTGLASLELGGTNAVGTLVDFTSFGNFDQFLFRNLTSLNVIGTIGGSSGTAVRLEVTGDLTLAGTANITGQGFVGPNVPLVALLATGNLTVDPGAVVQTFGSNSADVSSMLLIAGWNGVSDAPNLASPTTLTLGGTVSGSTIGSATTLLLTLGAGTGGITQTAGAVRAVRLEIQSGGDALLASASPGTPNEVGTLLTSNVARDLDLSTRTTTAYGSFGLALEGTQTVGRTMSLDVAAFSGSIVQLPGGQIIAPRLEVAGGSVALLEPNLIDVLGTSPVDNNLDLHNAQALRVQDTVGGTVSSFVNILVDNGDLTIEGTVRAVFGGNFTTSFGNVVVAPTGQILTNDDTVLRAGGDIIVNGLVDVQPGTLMVFAEGAVNVGATGILRVDSSSSMDVLASYDSDFPGSDPAGAGGTTLAGTISGGTVTVGAGTPGIVQTGGSIVADRLFVTSGGSAVFDRGGQTGGTLNAVNFIHAPSIPGDLVLDNGNTPILPGTDLTAANIGLRTSATIDGHGTLLMAPGGRISLRGGTVLARNYQLIAGSVVEIAPDSAVPMIVGGPAGPGFRVIAADLSQISATDTLRLGGTTFGGVLDITAASVQFVAPLAVANRLDVRSLGTITQDPGADITAALFAGYAGGATVLTNPGNAIAVVEDFAALGPFTLLTSGALGIAGHLDASGQAVDLTAAGGGIASAGPGRISANALALNGAGAIALTGANAVRFLGPVTTNAAGDIAFVNTGALTLTGTITPGAAGAVGFNVNGTLDQTTSGDIVAGRLGVTATGDVVLTAAPNVVPVLDTSSAANLALATSTGLQIAGPVSTGVAQFIVGGPLGQTAAGVLAASLLTGSATDVALATAVNALGGIGNFVTPGGFVLANASPGLGIPAGALLDAGGAVQITQAGGPLVADGTVRGSTVSLTGDISVAVNGFSAIAYAGGLLLSAPMVTVNGLISAAGNIIVTAPAAAVLGGQAIASGAGLSVTSPNVTFTGLNAAGTPVSIDLGAAGTASGALDALSLLVIGGSGATLTGSIAGVTTDAAAAIGRRANAQGVLYGDPPPDAQLFTFNGCQLATAICQPLIPPLVVIGPLPTLLANNPQPLLDNLDPELDPTSLERLRPDTPAIVARLPRDRSEEDTLAPADIRAEDY